MKNLLKRLLGFKDKSNSAKIVYKTEEELKSEIDTLKINGFSLPKAIVRRIKNDTWKVPINKDKLEELIVKNSPFEEDEKALKEVLNDFTLYSLGLMKNESEALVKWLHPEWEGDRIILLGKKDPKIHPGDIDTRKNILFGDLGLGSDTPFGLDFRESAESPSVILLYWGENSYTDNRWKKIANSFEEFERIVWGEE